MSDGFFLPDKQDGMAAFPSSKANEVILVRNHEINPGTPPIDGPFGPKNKKLEEVLKALFMTRANPPCMGRPLRNL